MSDAEVLLLRLLTVVVLLHCAIRYKPSRTTLVRLLVALICTCLPFFWKWRVLKEIWAAFFQGREPDFEKVCK